MLWVETLKTAAMLPTVRLDVARNDSSAWQSFCTCFFDDVRAKTGSRPESQQQKQQSPHHPRLNGPQAELRGQFRRKKSQPAQANKHCFRNCAPA